MSRGNTFYPLKNYLVLLATTKRVDEEPLPKHRGSSRRAMLGEKWGNHPLPEAWQIQSCVGHQPPVPRFQRTTMPVSRAQPRHELKDSKTFSGMKVEIFRSLKAFPFRFPTAEAKVFLGTAEIKLLLHAWLWDLVPWWFGSSRASWFFISKCWIRTPLFHPGPALAS